MIRVLYFVYSSLHTRLRQLADFPSLILRLSFAYPSLILRSSFGVGISEVKGRYGRKNSVSILF